MVEQAWAHAVLELDADVRVKGDGGGARIGAAGQAIIF
jgi:hypothetical protein